MYKIRLTDAVQIDTYLILKPEVEMEFDDELAVEHASNIVLDRLDFVVNHQLDQLARRVVKSPDKIKSILTNAAVDTRFKRLIRMYK